MTRRENRSRGLTAALVLATTVVVMVILGGPGGVGASLPKPDGEACRFNQNCLGGVCVKTPPSTKFGVCCASGLSTDTTCDGVDDDCDGSVDEEFVSQETTCGVGACAATGETICEVGEVQNTCTPGTPAPETCNGIDDDCDGSVDEGGVCDDGGACTPGMTACSDGCDNDNDGRVDGDDVECTGAIDNDESSFSTGIPGDNRDSVMQDCFFDGNSGSRADGCEIHVCCLLGAQTVQDCPIGADQYNPTACTQPQSQTCQTYCEALTPAGCDCFGCCTMCDPATNACFDIITNPATAPNCDETAISDPQKCPRCTKSTSCDVPCGFGCVLCPGQDPSDLPADCTSGAECPVGRVRCAADNSCPSGQFCANNCCIDGIP